MLFRSVEPWKGSVLGDDDGNGTPIPPGPFPFTPLDPGLTPGGPNSVRPPIDGITIPDPTAFHLVELPDETATPIAEKTAPTTIGVYAEIDPCFQQSSAFAELRNSGPGSGTTADFGRKALVTGPSDDVFQVGHHVVKPSERIADAYINNFYFVTDSYGAIRPLSELTISRKSNKSLQKNQVDPCANDSLSSWVD